MTSSRIYLLQLTIPVLGFAFARDVFSITCKDCIKITENGKWRCFTIKKKYGISRKIILTVHFIVINYLTAQ